MKDKQFACIVVVMAIIACFFGIMKMQNKLQDARKRAKSAKATAESTERQRVNAVNAYNNLQVKSANEIEYYKLWEPYFRFRTPPDATEQLNSVIASSQLTPFKSRANPYGDKDKYGVINQVQRTTLEFVDDYAKLFNWLGNVENQIMVSRITSLLITKATGEADIKIEVTIDVPIIPDEESADTQSS